MEKPRGRGEGGILTKSQGMLRLVKSLMPHLFCQLSLDSGGRAEKAPSRLLEAEAVHVVSQQPAEHQLHRLLGGGQDLPPSLLPLIPQPKHQPRQRAQSHLRSSFRAQQPKIGRGLPQRGSFQTTGALQVN